MAGTPEGRPTTPTLRRVAKNTAVPLAASLLNKALDVVFAVIILRVLGPADIGRYTWAVLVVGYFDIAVNFGLGVLITRDVARDPSAANRYLGGGAGRPSGHLDRLLRGGPDYGGARSSGTRAHS